MQGYSDDSIGTVTVVICIDISAFMMMIMAMMCTSVSSYARPFVVRCMGVGPRWVGYGLGWVSYLVSWVGFGSMKWTHGQHCVSQDS